MSWPVWHLTGVCSSRCIRSTSFLRIIPCHDPPAVSPWPGRGWAAVEKLSSLVIWALRGWRCSQRSGWMDAHTSGKDAALAPAPWSSSRWAEVLAASWLGPSGAVSPFAARSGSSYKLDQPPGQLSACMVRPCLTGMNGGVLTKRWGMDTEDLP